MEVYYATQMLKQGNIVHINMEVLNTYSNLETIYRI